MIKKAKDFMQIAIDCARRAGAAGDVPVGAVIVKKVERVSTKHALLGVFHRKTPHHNEPKLKIIARGENFVQRKKNPTLHAELVAISRACKKLDSKFLDDCEIYVSLEPCAMCATAISFARIKKIIFAARDEKGGGILHNARVYETDRHLWKPVVEESPDHAGESAKLLKDFFKEKRKN